MTIETHDPKLEALIEHKLQTGAFRDTDELLTKAIGALDPPSSTNEAQPESLLEFFKPIRGLLTDEEIDTLFCRNPSVSRELDLS